MARKKAGSNEFQEDPDEAEMDGEVTGVTDDPAPETVATVEPTLHPPPYEESDEGSDSKPSKRSSKGPKVELTDKKKPKEPELTETTKAEQAAGRAALSGGKKPEEDEPA